MKTIYFIRHGESEGNAGLVRQDGTSPLSARGREQAAFMAERCARLPLDALVASTMVRARHTAEIIGARIGKEVVLSGLFAERARPTSQSGKPNDDPEALAVDTEIWNNFGVAGYRHSDEENFEDLCARAKAALDFLASRPEEHVAVVTHGYFMRIILSYVVFRERLTSEECRLFIRTFQLANTGLTVMEYAGADKEIPWRVRTWNDRAHLG
jgi:probable phosphoglycerate mutase